MYVKLVCDSLWYVQLMELILQECRQTTCELMSVTDHSLQPIAHRLWRSCINCITVVDKSLPDSLSSDQQIGNEVGEAIRSRLQVYSDVYR